VIIVGVVIPIQSARRTTVTMADPATVLPTMLFLDDSDSPSDVIDALLLASFTAGRQPWARSERLDRVKADATLMPAGATVVRVAVHEGGETRLAMGDGWTLRCTRWRGDSAEVTVTAASEALAVEVLADATRDATEPAPEDETVTVGFWQIGSGRGYRFTRQISADPWAQIRDNYAPAESAAFDRLVAMTSDDVRGRLLLLHGAPGTGKTTVLRSLAREWRDWCQVDCVLDSERLFGDPGYLMSVAVGAESGEERRWRLLILEDCDELIRGEAKQTTGQALSRLLNLTDGMLGQGRDVLIGITTNEDLARLHPAVVRPGRCLAKIEVGPLPRERAVAWLEANGAAERADRIGPAGATLAELYAVRDGEEPVTASREPAPIGGFYL
jgi:hypothetical protein